jgi:hypothetical protein
MKKFLLLTLIMTAIAVFMVVGTPKPVSAEHHKVAAHPPSANHLQSVPSDSNSALLAVLDSIAIPETGSLLLMGSGLLVGAVYLRKKYFDGGK